MNSENLFVGIVQTPAGKLVCKFSDLGLRRIEFLKDVSIQETEEVENKLFIKLKRQLDEYFSRKRKYFDITVDVIGTDFQKEVWLQLLQIPYGQTRSYASQAKELGKPLAIRAIAAANGKNPLPIVWPCHRIVGAKGEMVGYLGGTEIKRFLLDVESGYKDLFSS
jgi:O-6-methylguanine DNA methyltransferase